MAIKQQYSCFEGLIGLTDKACDCLPAVPEEDKLSSSGYYLDDYVSSCLTLKYGSCDDADLTLWDRLKTSIEKEANVFGDYLIGFLSKKYKYTEPIQPVIVGMQDYSSPLYSVTTATLSMKTKEINGYSFLISKIGVLLNSSANITVTVRKKLNGTTTTIKTITMSVVGYDKTLSVIKNNENVPTPIELPCDGSEYEFSFPTGGSFVLNNQCQPACHKCREYLIPLNTLLANSINCEYANGFLLEISSKCEKNQLICQLLNDDLFRSHISQMYVLRCAIRALNDSANSSSNYNFANSTLIQQAVIDYQKKYKKLEEELLQMRFPIIPCSCFVKTEYPYSK